MKLKLDENLGRQAKLILKKAGHDVTTVPQQNLQLSPDDKLIQVCQSEKRCLITLDLGFANPLVYRPSRFCGIAVLRPPQRPDNRALLKALGTLIDNLKQQSIKGKLWILEVNRVREYEEETGLK